MQVSGRFIKSSSVYRKYLVESAQIGNICLPITLIKFVGIYKSSLN